jgi:hypothetical protein
MNENQYTFDKGTPPEVASAVNALRDNGHRARFFFGDRKTGRDWMEEWMVMGTIGRSTGPCHIPLLIHNQRSMGGPALSTSSIVRIIDMQTGRELYKHPAYNPPFLLVGTSDLPEYEAVVLRDGEIQARFHSTEAAKRYIDFMMGRRFNK